MGLTSQTVQPETTLTFSHPHCAHENQRPRGAANPKCVLTRGNLAKGLACSPAWEKVVVRPSGGGYLFCFDLLKA